MGPDKINRRNFIHLTLPEASYVSNALQQRTLTPELPPAAKAGLGLRILLLLSACAGNPTAVPTPLTEQQFGRWMLTPELVRTTGSGILRASLYPENVSSAMQNLWLQGDGRLKKVRLPGEQELRVYFEPLVGLEPHDPGSAATRIRFRPTPDDSEEFYILGVSQGAVKSSSHQQFPEGVQQKLKGVDYAHEAIVMTAKLRFLARILSVNGIDAMSSLNSQGITSPQDLAALQKLLDAAVLQSPLYAEMAAEVLGDYFILRDLVDKKDGKVVYQEGVKPTINGIPFPDAEMFYLIDRYLSPALSPFTSAAQVASSANDDLRTLLGYDIYAKEMAVRFPSPTLL